MHGSKIYYSPSTLSRDTTGGFALLKQDKDKDKEIYLIKYVICKNPRKETLLKTSKATKVHSKLRNFNKVKKL